jgi:predicted transcriptional regulator
MQQVNFRLSDDEKQVLHEIAQKKGISIAEFAKNAVLKELHNDRKELAFNLLKEGKIGRKKAFILSGLTYNEFLLEWDNRKIVEKTSDKIFEDGFSSAKNLNGKSLKR